MGIYGGLMGIYGGLMGSNGNIPGLVNVYKKLWKDPAFFMGKFTISMAIFNSKLLVYQRVNPAK